MKATETKLLDFLKGPKQFIIPIYQRTYSWTLKQCDQLWRDLVRAATDDDISGHFIGSIVYIEKGLYQISSVPQLLVIDGQQRLTTASLLLAALARAIENAGTDGEISQKKLFNYFLLNNEEEGDLQFKLLLTQSDKPTLIRLLEGKELPEPVSRRVIENHDFFQRKLAESELDPLSVYRGLAKLIIVDIALNREHDNPQLIFESLNSTGLKLTQADLIRNYVLMGLEPKQQEVVYADYWYPMETRFGQANYNTHFDRFMRDYLTVVTGRIPNIGDVYEAFKVHASNKQSGSVEDIVAHIYRFSKYFVRIAFEEEPDDELQAYFHDINTLKVDVAYPFLLELYDDFEKGHISRKEVIEILALVESYVFRRAICGIPTNSLNKTFSGLTKEIDTSRYVESVRAAFLLKTANTRFPDDDEFTRELVVKDLYTFRNRNYWLRKLENHDRKERVNVEEYTIEHIMPQNKNLSATWKAELGEHWEELHSRYLHTLGNLTLTGYNPELSDRSFKEKRDLKGGFADSPLRLNEGLGKLDCWGEQQILQRAERLAQLALKVWSAPRLSDTVLEGYRQARKQEAGRTYTLEDHPQLAGDTRTLFDHLRKRILNLNASVREEVLKLYIAYKASTNFVDVIPQKRGLKLTLNMDFDEIHDPKGLCEDVTNLGRWGNGNVQVVLTDLARLEDVMMLIQQSFEKHAETGEA